jgi:hypothetical protein
MTFQELELNDIFILVDDDDMVWHEKISDQQANVLDDFFDRRVIKTISVAPERACCTSTELFR